MASHTAVRAIEDATETGKAILKFISPNDVGATGGHQYGFYLPKQAWQLFTPHPPEKGRNDKSEVQITWEDGSVTDSIITWYGKGSRSEYRLTKFGRDFPFLNSDLVGCLLVLVIESHGCFRAYILDTDDDIEEMQASLGVEIADRCSVFDAAAAPQPESENACLDRLFRRFAAGLSTFPSTTQFSEHTRSVVLECVEDLIARSYDDVLRRLVDAEYELFRIVERQICTPDLTRVFRDVDDFLRTASTIMNRRKSRAGRALENHVGFVLRNAGIPFDSRCRDINGEPDVVIPGAAAYRDESYPIERLCVVGVKTTCKDRWRQVLNEASRVNRRYILTLQPAISANQLREMAEARVSLVVPKHLHRGGYPTANRNGVELFTVDQFVEHARTIVRS